MSETTINLSVEPDTFYVYQKDNWSINIDNNKVSICFDKRPIMTNCESKSGNYHCQYNNNSLNLTVTSPSNITSQPKRKITNRLSAQHVFETFKKLSFDDAKVAYGKTYLRNVQTGDENELILLFEHGLQYFSFDNYKIDFVKLLLASCLQLNMKISDDILDICTSQLSFDSYKVELLELIYSTNSKIAFQNESDEKE